MIAVLSVRTCYCSRNIPSRFFRIRMHKVPVHRIVSIYSMLETEKDRLSAVGFIFFPACCSDRFLHASSAYTRCSKEEADLLRCLQCFRLAPLQHKVREISKRQDQNERRIAAFGYCTSTVCRQQPAPQSRLAPLRPSLELRNVKSAGSSIVTWLSGVLFLVWTCLLARSMHCFASSAGPAGIWM